jgi:hypothetical protein
MYRTLLLATVAGSSLLASASDAKAQGFGGVGYGPRLYPRPLHRPVPIVQPVPVYRPVPIVQPVPIYRPVPIVQPVPVYNVYYRTCATAPWAVYQGFPAYADAFQATFALRARGFEVFVR